MTMLLTDRQALEKSPRREGPLQRALDGLMTLTSLSGWIRDDMAQRKQEPESRDLHDALLAALRRKDVDQVRQILTSSQATAAGITGNTPLGVTRIFPLTVAVQAGSLECVNVLVAEFGASAQASAFQDELGNSLVVLAIQKNDSDMALRLIELGAVVSVSTEGQRSPLSLAMDARLDDVACKLIEAGADLTRLETGKETPLHKASRCGSERCVQALIQAGADINAEDWIGHTPLHEAVEGSSIACARSLMAAGADWRKPNQLWLTPLQEAVRFRNADMIKALMEAGADLTFEVDGLSALVMASQSPAPDVAAIGQALNAKLVLERIAQRSRTSG